MTIRDSGIIKWNSLILPEYVKMLQAYFCNEDEQTKKPALDEYQWQALGEKIQSTMKLKLPVKVTVWEGGYFKDYLGTIHRIDDIGKKLYIKEKGDCFILKVDFEDIVDVAVKEGR